MPELLEIINHNEQSYIWIDPLNVIDTDKVLGITWNPTFDCLEFVS